MANPFSQKVRQRKFAYLALLLVLFTVSLIHRRFWIQPKAEQLRLREVARGEVELTSSAVRLSLIGVRGITVTFLWSKAIEEFKRHEWNRFELTAGAITKLQPYFITPWLYQGWNLAYNVAVECDRPHDKYYYVSRGLNLFAEGERRNHEQGINPGDPNDKGVGQPDLRHQIGFTYQGKFGHADEKHTMRSLLDMSCIDPVRRNPDRFWTVDADGRQSVNLQELAKLCRDYPRFVRRLREHLGYTDAKQIIAFLSDNRELPNRFETPTGGASQVETPLKKDIRDQFPILPDPAKHGQHPPNPLLPDFGLTNESLDIYVVARAWFEFAQQPLPPPLSDHLEEAKREGTIDRSRYRRPKSPSTPIFRSYPARAQNYAAEVMEEEGWFDADGWLIRDWFDSVPFDPSGESRVGTQLKYHAGPAWKRGYDSYRSLGLATGQYFSPEREAEMERSANVYRTKFDLKPGDLSPPALSSADRQNPQMVKGWEDHQRLALRDMIVRMTNFDGHFRQAEAELTDTAVLARKFFYAAQRLRTEDPDRALALYEAAWPYWLSTCVRFPRFNELVGEDAYENQLKQLRLMQRHYPVLYRSLAAGMAQFAVWPHVPLEPLLDAAKKGSILPIRSVRGPLESTRVYGVKQKDELGRFLLAWSQAAGMPRMYLFPGQEDWTLIALDHRDRELKPGWSHLTQDYIITSVRQRLNLSPTPMPPGSGPAADQTPQLPGEALPTPPGR